MQESWERLREGKLFQGQQWWERDGKTCLGKLFDLGKKGAFYRSPRNIAVAGNGTFKSDQIRNGRTRSGGRISSGAIRQQPDIFTVIPDGVRKWPDLVRQRSEGFHVHSGRSSGMNCRWPDCVRHPDFVRNELPATGPNPTAIRRFSRSFRTAVRYELQMAGFRPASGFRPE